ncbi:MAG: hypothetical protein AAGG02_08225 [Cyanobacteria bacterium P01_H01_bin.15]
MVFVTTPTNPTTQPTLRLVKSSPLSDVVQPAATTQLPMRTTLQQFNEQAAHINQLAQELESAIADLQTLAVQIQTTQKNWQRAEGRSLNLCELRSVKLPVVRRKNAGRVVVTSRSLPG